MAGHAGRFGDVPDEEGSTPPLPPDDRLWRHPSELGPGARADEIRHRWLTSRPSRASAWTAGLVGALLATGIVALGTHLATALTSGQVASDTPANEGVAQPVVATTAASGGLLGSELAGRIADVGQAVTTLDAMVGGEELSCLGLVIDADGTILAPARDLIGANGVEVTLADGTPYVAQAVRIDATSGLAVLRIHPAGPLTVARLLGGAAQGSLALAVTEPGGSAYALGSLSILDRPGVGAGANILATLQTDLPPSRVPMGSVLLDADGTVVGMVTGASGSGALATPAWMARAVAAQLSTSGLVHPGWLDVYAEDAPASASSEAGIKVLATTPDRAGRRAGLQPGDVITRFDGVRVTSLGGLDSRLYVTRPGTRVTLQVERGQKLLTLHARLDSGPVRI